MSALTCCGICADVARILDLPGMKAADVVDFFRFPPESIARVLRQHGHYDLARRVHVPAARATVAAKPARKPSRQMSLLDGVA